MPDAVRWSSWILGAHGLAFILGAGAVASPAGAAPGRWSTLGVVSAMGLTFSWCARGIRQRNLTAHRVAIAVTAVAVVVSLAQVPKQGAVAVLSAAPMTYVFWSMRRASVRSWFVQDSQVATLQFADDRMSQLARRRLAPEAPDLGAISRRLSEGPDREGDLPS